MKVTVKYIQSDLSEQDKSLIKSFIKFLNKEYELKNDINVEFLGERYGEMTTGSRMENKIKVLTKNRMNRDILRTLAHEWVHEYQRTIQKREHGPNIGGRNEDEANAFAGRLVKMFEKENPSDEEMMYENVGLNKKLNLLTEKINYKEKELIHEGFINEMKKIGIEKLPYSYSALKRFVDPETMDVHYNKHYKGYVKKLNDALSEKNYGDLELEEIILKVSKFNDKIRNNAGGAFNHALFWKMLSPKKQLPKGDLIKKINDQYGSLKKLKDEFNQIASERFGSGWVWLILLKNGNLKIMSTPNQDNPMMDIVDKGGFPILGLDVWEHAYYLRYKNKRDQYVKNFWNYINWEFVDQLYNSKKKSKNQINEIAVRTHSKIDYLCDYANSQNIQKSPFCKLQEYRDNLTDRSIINSLERSIIILDKFFDRKIVGSFPMIVDLSLVNEEKTKNFLDLISDFVISKEIDVYSKHKIMKELKKVSVVPDTIDDLLSLIRAIGHQEYEKSFEGEDFYHRPKKLQLNYKCSDDQKEKFFESLQSIKDGNQTLNFFFFQITNCLSNSFRKGIYYIKSDLESKRDLFDENGELIFKKNSNFEVKKMDPFIDSYLSEFFSIFKETKIRIHKEEYLDLYNELIDRIFYWLLENDLAKKYLEKVKKQMAGIIYENNLIVPIDKIDLYWSNKGQRGCAEKRLSIRFRIKPNINVIQTYKYLGNSMVKKIILDVPRNERVQIICEK
jgi:Fe-Mn family superoxide dismutase